MNDATTRGAPSLKTTWLTLFASIGTLICCALPIIFVSGWLLYRSSVAIWCFGFFAAFLALPLRIWLGL